MKLAAHPMVVAVALGLLPPSALEVVAGTEPASSERSLDEWEAMPAPSAESQALVAEEYLRIWE